MSSSSKERSKEIKIVPRQVVTPEHLLNSERVVKLLYVLNRYGEISEKGIQHLLYEMKQRGADFGYSFFKMGDSVVSKQLRDDVTGLLYLELLETKHPGKKFVVTSKGKDELEKRVGLLSEDFKALCDKLVEELKGLVASIDAEQEYRTLRQTRR